MGRGVILWSEQRLALERALTLSVPDHDNKDLDHHWSFSSFGRELALSALRSGDAVVAAVRRPEAVADIASEHPDGFSTVTFDVRDTEAAPGVVEHALERFGRVDVLVNNAGRGMVGAAELVDDSTLRDLIELHLIGPAALVRAALPSMRVQGSGTIVQMSSQGGRMSFPGVGAYSASKFALEGWSELSPVRSRSSAFG